MTNYNDQDNKSSSKSVEESLEAENAESTLTTEEKLNMETGTLLWKDLELFFAKGNLIRVENSQDLIKVAAMIADNAHQEIEVLIANKQIEFMTPDWVKNNCESNSEFWTVVVAPYVVCQPK